MQSSWFRTWLPLLAGVFALSVAVGRAIGVRSGGPDRTEASVIRAEALPRLGGQLVLVYVGSSRCGPSNAADLPSLVGKITERLRATALQDSLGFVRIGVAREVSAKSGLVHLSKFGGFDEISVGQGVLNATGEKYLTGDHRGDAATPQLIVVARRIGGSLGAADPDSVVERVLVRKVGLVEISDWLALDVPLPLIDSIP